MEYLKRTKKMKERLYRALVENENGEREVIEVTDVNEKNLKSNIYGNGYEKIIFIRWIKKGTYEYEATLENKPYLKEYLV